MTKPVNILGDTYGRLTVLSRAENSPRGRTRWKCLCVCGVEKVVSGEDLRTGHTKSCGCLVFDGTLNGNRKHGKSWTPEWKVWIAMNRRCYDTKQKYYPQYGGRGITVCDRWRSSFENFYSDMGKRPDEMSLERIDVNGSYEPSNCKWASHKEQARNTTRTRLVTLNNKTQSLAAWIEELGVKSTTVRSRLYNLKWSPEKALLGKKGLPCQ